MPEPARATDKTSSDARLLNLVGALATGLTDAVNDGVTEVTGLDPAASTALIALLDFLPGGSVRRLSQVVGLTHSGAVRLLDRLVDAGLVARTTGNRRALPLAHLDRAGRLLGPSRAERGEARIARIVDEVPQRDRAVLTQLCEGLVATITRQRLAQRALMSRPRAAHSAGCATSPRAGDPAASAPPRTRWLRSPGPDPPRATACCCGQRRNIGLRPRRPGWYIDH